MTGSKQERVTSPLRLFYSYSHRDENYRDELAKHLRLLERKGILTSWYDRRISPGDEWKGEIDENLATADIILLLVSPDFIASDYCYDVELEHAMQRHNSGTARVIPVILRAVNWYDAPFGILQALPSDGKPISAWDNQDTAWSEVERGVRHVIQEITNSVSARPEVLREILNEEDISDLSDAEEREVAANHGRALIDIETREIELTIDIDFDKYTERDKKQLLNAIASLLKIKDSDLRIKKMRRGSTRITFELPAALADQLYLAVKAGKLKPLGVSNVEFKVKVAQYDDSARTEDPVQEGIDELFIDAYKELEILARSHLRREKPDVEFGPGELINEVYLKFRTSQTLAQDRSQFFAMDRPQFFAMAGTAMRRVLMDYAHQHLTAKRGRASEKLIDREELILRNDQNEELLDLDEALKRLEATDPRQSKIIELRYFAGLSTDEIADMLELDSSTVAHEFRLARAWLRRDILPKHKT